MIPGMFVSMNHREMVDESPDLVVDHPKDLYLIQSPKGGSLLWTEDAMIQLRDRRDVARYLVVVVGGHVRF